MTITQTVKELVVSRASATGDVRTIYRLDGGKTLDGSGPAAWTSTARWEGTKLVVSLTRTAQGRRDDRVIAYYFDGCDLVQDVTLVGRGGGAKTYYRRSDGS